MAGGPTHCELRPDGGGPAFDTVFTTELDLFFYRLNYRFARNWRAAGAAPFRFIRQTGPNAVRYLAKQDIGHLIRDAGWHFSWMGDLKRFAAKRKALLEIANNESIEMQDRFEARLKLAELPRNSSATRIRNRCEITGRPRAFYRKMGISRVALRELGNRGLIPGLVKSSW